LGAFEITHASVFASSPPLLTCKPLFVLPSTAIVDPAENIINSWDWDTKKDWFHAFSGGQKQRVAMARLFYHCPRFAILDECTSAVSDEIEDKIYETCSQIGITIFTVSHRPSLARHHHVVLKFTGNGGWQTAPGLARKPNAGNAIDSATDLKQVKGGGDSGRAPKSRS
jgi:hypothetical protein